MSENPMNEPPKSIAIYLHIPFCLHKCGYCDFNSYALDTLLEKGHATQNWAASYADAVIREIENRCTSLDLAERPVESIFFGGGTPSLFPVEETARIMDALQRRFTLSPSAEITLEANPGASDVERFAALGEAGINRLSIGMQSFDDEALRRFDRIHTGDDARAAFHSARAAGFSNVSLDLMFGIPFQTPDQAKADIESALALAPEHLSAYELTIEPGTHFGALHSRGELSGLPDEDAALAMWEMRDRLLSKAGYERYEISNFARPGFRCRHNMNYWKRGEYLGVGAGAHSLIGGRRFWNHARPDIYAENAEDPTSGEENIQDKKKAIGESLMLGLRLREGVSLREISQKCGADPEEKYGETFSRLEKDGLLERSNGAIHLTHRGTLLANRVLAEFL
jgi:oxygen-independent coproporphyrinogen-3 oxidase